MTVFGWLFSTIRSHFIVERGPFVHTELFQSTSWRISSDPKWMILLWRSWSSLRVKELVELYRQDSNARSMIGVYALALFWWGDVDEGVLSFCQHHILRQQLFGPSFSCSSFPPWCNACVACLVPKRWMEYTWLEIQPLIRCSPFRKGDTTALLSDFIWKGGSSFDHGVCCCGMCDCIRRYSTVCCDVNVIGKNSEVAKEQKDDRACEIVMTFKSDKLRRWSKYKTYNDFQKNRWLGLTEYYYGQYCSTANRVMTEKDRQKMKLPRGHDSNPIWQEVRSASGSLSDYIVHCIDLLELLCIVLLWNMHSNIIWRGNEVMTYCWRMN